MPTADSLNHDIDARMRDLNLSTAEQLLRDGVHDPLAAAIASARSDLRKSLHTREDAREALETLKVEGRALARRAVKPFALTAIIGIIGTTAMLLIVSVVLGLSLGLAVKLFQWVVGG
jgi:hypothetical protein